MNERIKQFGSALPNLGEQVRLWRISRHLTQAELEQKTGLSHNAVSRIECGIVSPRLDTVERIAGALNLSIEQLQFQNPSVKVEEDLSVYGDENLLNDLIVELTKVPEPKRTKLVRIFMDLVRITLEEDNA